MSCQGFTLKGNKCHRKVVHNKFCFQHCNTDFRQAKPTDCIVCCESLENQQKALQCGHWVHTNCIIESAKEECPVCRHPLDLNKRAKKKLIALAKKRNIENILEEENEILASEGMSSNLITRINNIVIQNMTDDPAEDFINILDELINDDEYQQFVYDLLHSSIMNEEGYTFTY